MKLTVCGCGSVHLERIERSWWMRLLFPGRRLYYCSACRSKRLIRKVLLARDRAGEPTAGELPAGAMKPAPRR